ncbi:MAG: hypothetical protein RL098_1575, partial [Bacteroidota bacterium]
MIEVEPMPYFVRKCTTRANRARANCTDVVMKNPDAILHAGCSPVTWFISIACSASYISTNENIKVFVSRPLTIINVVTCHNGIHLIAAVVTLITHRRESTCNAAKTLAIWRNGCQFELHLNVCRHTLKIGVHIGSIGILLAIV